MQNYLQTDFIARQKETTIQRRKLLNDWSDFVLKENDFYSSAIMLLIIDGITKNLKSNNDKLPPVLNKEVVASTISNIQDGLKINPKVQIDFNKIYQTKLMELSKTHHIDSSKDTNNTRWIIIKSKKNDPENFEQNVQDLKALSHKNWCTKSFHAKYYLSDGDFHIYLENDAPKIGIRFNGDTVKEIQGEKNNTQIPLKYLDMVKEYIKNFKLDEVITRELKREEDLKLKTQDIEKQLGKSFNEATSKELFKIFGMLDSVDKYGQIVLKEYRQPDVYFNWEDIGIDENKLFQNIKEIKEEGNFCNSKVTNLGILRTIGGDANFNNSKVTNLGSLRTIGGSIYLWNSQIRNLGNLSSIDGNVYSLSYSYLTETDFDNVEFSGKFL